CECVHRGSAPQCEQWRRPAASRTPSPPRSPEPWTAARTTCQASWRCPAGRAEGAGAERGLRLTLAHHLDDGCHDDPSFGGYVSLYAAVNGLTTDTLDGCRGPHRGNGESDLFAALGGPLSVSDLLRWIPGVTALAGALGRVQTQSAG